MKFIGKAIAGAVAAAAFVQAPVMAEPWVRPGAAGSPAQVGRQQVLPQGTILRVTPAKAITSKGMHEGDEVEFKLAQPVRADGTVILQRGAPVKAFISWRAKRNFFGKRAKFDVTFRSITIGGHDWPVSGRTRQVAQGNTPGAWLDSLAGRPPHAVVSPGRIFEVRTAQDIPLS